MQTGHPSILVLPGPRLTARVVLETAWGQAPSGRSIIKSVIMCPPRSLINILNKNKCSMKMTYFFEKDVRLWEADHSWYMRMCRLFCLDSLIESSELRKGQDICSESGMNDTAWVVAVGRSGVDKATINTGFYFKRKTNYCFVRQNRDHIAWRETFWWHLWIFRREARCWGLHASQEEKSIRTILKNLSEKETPLPS